MCTECNSRLCSAAKESLQPQLKIKRNQHNQREGRTAGDSRATPQIDNCTCALRTCSGLKWQTCACIPNTQCNGNTSHHFSCSSFHSQTARKVERECIGAIQPVTKSLAGEPFYSCISLRLIVQTWQQLSGTEMLQQPVQINY